ncbi:MAG: DUF2934 domain-containing protein, partial [Gemmatimonadaceae bacterium]
MSEVPVQGTSDGECDLPVFREMSERADAVRMRAHALFEERGGVHGHELDDWLTAEREVLGWPNAEFKESDNAYEVDVTLPGFAAADVEVTATPSEIVLHAMRHDESPREEGATGMSSLRMSDVYRRLGFPKGIVA